MRLSLHFLLQPELQFINFKKLGHDILEGVSDVTKPVNDFACSVTGAKKKLSNLEREHNKKVVPALEKLHKLFAIAEIYCNFDIDKKYCKQVRKLKKQIKQKEKRIEYLQREIAALKQYCG